MNGIELITAERRRQEELGHTASHDRQHKYGELALAGGLYAQAAAEVIEYQTLGSIPEVRVMPPLFWPWNTEDWKPTPDDPSRQLVKAGALIAAAIDNLEERNDKQTKADRLC